MMIISFIHFRETDKQRAHRMFSRIFCNYESTIFFCNLFIYSYGVIVNVSNSIQIRGKKNRRFVVKEFVMRKKQMKRQKKKPSNLY